MGESPYILYRELPARALTARNLEDYALCPQKYLLSFFQPPGETERTLGGPAVLHQAVRAALIELYRQGGPPAIPPEKLKKLFEARWDGRACADSREEEELHRLGLRILCQYHERHVAEPVQTLASDLRMEAEIGGYRFVAVADRVDEQPEGNVTLLRYRTTLRPPGAGELSRDLSARMLWLVGERHWGRPVRVAAEALRRGKVILAEFPAAVRKETEERLVRQAQEIRRATDFFPRQGKHCRHCRSRPRCPAWQGARERPA